VHRFFEQQGPDGKPLAGCLSPCLAGVRGHVDGSLTASKFSFPTDVEVFSPDAGGNTVLVSEHHAIRRVTYKK
jgi:hypothetical protein